MTDKTTRNQRKSKNNQANAAVTSPPVKSRKALTKVEHVRAELASLYRQARAGQVAIGDAGKLTYVLTSLARLIEGSDLEARIADLENRLQATEGCTPASWGRKSAMPSHLAPGAKPSSALGRFPCMA